MATKEERYAEAYRRGILPADKKAMYEEAVRRGLMSNPELKARLEGINLPDINLPKRTNAESLMESGVEAGKGLAQAGVNLLNIPGLIVNTALDAMGVPKEDQVMSLQLPESMRPTDPYAKFGAEIGPYLVPGVDSARVATALSSAKGASFLARASTKAAEILAENLPGALAQATQDGSFGRDLTSGAAGSSAARALLGPAGKFAGPVIKSAREWLSPVQKVTSEAATAARQGVTSTSEAAQEQAAAELGKIITAKDYSAIAGEIKPQQSILDAARALNMEDALIPSHYSGSQTYRSVEQGLKSVPASQLSAKEHKAIGQLAQKADDLISLAGGTPDKVALSEKFVAESMKTIHDLSKKAEDIYSEIGSKIPNNTPMTAPETTALLHAKGMGLGGTEKLSAGERKILADLQEERTYLPARVNRPAKWEITKQPTYGMVDNTRKQLGAAINKHEGPFKNEVTAALKTLYEKITTDQGGVVNSFGLGEKWDLAKNLVSQRKQLEGEMTNALGRNLNRTFMSRVSPAIQNLRKGNVQAFDELINATPPSMRQEVVASALQDVFTLGSRKEQQLHIPGFVSWYEGAQKSGALDRVMKLLPREAQQNLTNIYKVGAGIRRANEDAISTGRLGTLIKAIDARNGALEHLYGATEKGAAAGGGSLGAMAGGAIGGVPGAAVGASIGAGLGGALASAAGKKLINPARSIAADQLMSTPEFQRALIHATERNKNAINQALGKLPIWKVFAGHLSGEEAKQIERVGIMNWLNGDADEPRITISRGYNDPENKQ